MQAGKYLHALFIPGVLCLLTISSFSFAAAVSATPEPAHKGEKAPALSLEDTKSVSGKVVETMDAKHYTYVLLEKDGIKTWMAVPTMKVTVGEELELWKGIEMKDFKSTNLNRTFERIFFSAGPVSGTGPSEEDIVSMAHQKKSVEKPAADVKEAVAAANKEVVTEQHHTLDKNREHDEAIIQDAHGGRTMADLNLTKAPVLDTLAEPIEKASGPDGYKISEIYEKQKELVGKEVTVRGRVVKIAAGVLQMNWIHLQDGSGSVSSGTHDITVTSAQDLPVAGEIVTMRGTVHLNKDFGAGYKYALILMEGKKE